LTFLLDTNVISEVRRNRDPQVRAWAKAVDDVDLYLSVMTLGEIRKATELLRGRDPRQADVFAGWLDELHRLFADRIMPIDARIAEAWGRLNATTPRNTVDSLIAATAGVHGLTVVTRNIGAFDGCGVSLLNPWQPEPGTSG
jgi:hypothetical protein